MGAWACGEKGLEDLNVYSISRKERLRSVRTLMCNGGWGACEGQALALRAAPQAPVGPDRPIRTRPLSLQSTCSGPVCDQAITNYRETVRR